MARESPTLAMYLVVVVVVGFPTISGVPCSINRSIHPCMHAYAEHYMVSPKKRTVMAVVPLSVSSMLGFRCSCCLFVR